MQDNAVPTEAHHEVDEYLQAAHGQQHTYAQASML